MVFEIIGYWCPKLQLKLFPIFPSEFSYFATPLHHSLTTQNSFGAKDVFLLAIYLYIVLDRDLLLFQKISLFEVNISTAIIIDTECL